MDTGSDVFGFRVLIKKPRDGQPQNDGPIQRREDEEEEDSKARQGSSSSSMANGVSRAKVLGT